MSLVEFALVPGRFEVEQPFSGTVFWSVLQPGSTGRAKPSQAEPRQAGPSRAGPGQAKANLRASRAKHTGPG